METHGSVTGWLDGLRAGDQHRAQQLWEAFFDRLVGLARAKLAGGRRTLDDPEDVALSAFNSFCAAAQKGRFPKLADRNDLWQIMVMLTGRKAIDAFRSAKPDDPAARDVDQIADSEPTPSFAAEIADQFRHLLDKLKTTELRTIAILSMEGCTNKEIAERRKISLATVERKLKLIRKKWEEKGESRG